MNLTLIIASIMYAFGVFVGYQWQGANITQLKAEYEQQQVSDARESLQKFERDSARVATAQAKAQLRRADSVVARNRTDNAASGLRLAATEAVQASSADLASCTAIVATYDALLAEGGKFIQEVAGVADECFSDLKTVAEAWPTR